MIGRHTGMNFLHEYISWALHHYIMTGENLLPLSNDEIDQIGADVYNRAFNSELSKDSQDS